MPKKAAKPKADYLNYAYLSAIFVLLLVTSFNVTLFIHERLATRVLGAQTEVIENYPDPLLKERAQWEAIIEKHPSYRDAYIELSDIEARLGNIRRAEELRNLARGVDPNYKLN
jgi:hypothetical protein